jgi:DNA helicase-2/ATP-dependent DNA helicase PcrA
MPSHKNEFIIASAGSRKTTLLVERALTLENQRVLITTYTNENLDQIRAYLSSKRGCLPKNISVMSWYTFLLQEGVRPYQNLMTSHRRIRSILFEALSKRAQFTKKTDIDNYYFTSGHNIYRDRTADFVARCDEVSNHLVTKRLEKIFGHILIDEFQDLAGADLDVVRLLLNSSIGVVTACDPRQATFSTNRSPKNFKYKGSKIVDWIMEQESLGLLSTIERTECYRSNQQICDFADALYPTMPKTISKNTKVTGHDGIFKISTKEVPDYVQKYVPTTLRYSKKTSTMDLRAMNIGLSKGRTYDHVLIFPTEGMANYLETKDLAKAGDLAKLYVAVTRAKYSVAFVI